MAFPIFLKTRQLLLGLAVLLLVPGCKTIDSSAVSNFAASTTAVKTHANDALNSVAALTRSESVAYAASQPTLTEASFAETPASDTIAAWDNAFAAMENYAQNLSALLAPGAAADFDTAATNLVGQFNETAARLKANSIHSQAGVSSLLATAFTEVADSIIRVRQQSKAIKIASATDGNIAVICDLFAQEIGSDRSVPGMRRTLYTAVWTPALARLSARFLSSDADKISLAQQYADCLARRDAEDQILASLRRSLLSLKDAHHALAQGKSASIQADLNLVASEIQHTRDLYDQFSSLNKKP